MLYSRVFEVKGCTIFNRTLQVKECCIPMYITSQGIVMIYSRIYKLKNVLFSYLQVEECSILVYPKWRNTLFNRMLQVKKSSIQSCMGWLRLVGSLKLQVSFAEYSLFYRAVLQKRPIILRSLQVVATPYHQPRDHYVLFRNLQVEECPIPLFHKSRNSLLIRAVPEILQGITSCHMARPKNLSVLIWSYSFDSLGYGSQH